MQLFVRHPVNGESRLSLVGALVVLAVCSLGGLLLGLFLGNGWVGVACGFAVGALLCLEDHYGLDAGY